ncbi:pyridoxamine 5'-phosphate oxidase [Microbulbifer sp.]|uniref:pyridoxamine 5'-phosphate oxidase n=1 Tax=Microbulbifer sp. TaxID=1908541 RepID=UPI003F2AC17A
MEIDQWRRDYLRGGLRREDLNADPMEHFTQWLREAVESELPDPSSMCLATADAGGQPSQRIVLLKGYDERGFVFYTNLESRKARDIAANPKVSLLFPWQSLERQVIVCGRAEQLSREDALIYFRTRPRDSQLAAWASRQGEVLSSRDQLEKQFEAIKSQYGEGEVPLPDFWGGYRVVPETVEFWQGGSRRLHDRFVYRREESGPWTIERLSP